MNVTDLKRMLGFGYSAKVLVASVILHSSQDSNVMIGQYGNGFKSGSMRLGKDAVVISCQAVSDYVQCNIGLLSQTYNEAHTQIRVPICTWELRGEEVQRVCVHLLTHTSDQTL